MDLGQNQRSKAKTNNLLSMSAVCLGGDFRSFKQTLFILEMAKCNPESTEEQSDTLSKLKSSCLRLQCFSISPDSTRLGTGDE